MENIVESIKSSLKEFEDKKKAMVEELRKQFPGLLKPLFDESKKINSISWNQYTPYYADGNTPEFGVNHYLIINDTINEDEDAGFLSKELYTYDDQGEGVSVPNPDYDLRESIIVKSLSETIFSIPDEFLRDLFGDHVEIIVYKDGSIKVNEYEHD